MPLRCGPNTFTDMKDAVITIRVPLATRKRIERLAREEGRSLSQAIERLIARGIATGVRGAGRRDGAWSLAGALRGGRVPTLADFREVRGELSRALIRSVTADDQRRR